MTNRGGRPLEFDPDTALAQMLRVFWEQGYDNTSVDDLEHATGLARPSLYNTFGKKRQIYEAAIDSYLDRFDAFVADYLVNGSDGLDDIDRFVVDLVAGYDNPAYAPGCAMLNDMAANGNGNDFTRARAQRYVATLTRGLTSAVDRAVELGEVSSDAASTVVSRMKVYLVGLNMLARNASTLADIGDHVEAIRSDLAAWRSARGRTE